MNHRLTPQPLFIFVKPCAGPLRAAGLSFALALAAAGAPTMAWAQPSNAAVVPALAAAQVMRYDSARDEYEIGHYGAAFAGFAQLADEGHCEAARVAQQMVRYGRSLYAVEFKVDAARLARWRVLAGCPLALARR